MIELMKVEDLDQVLAIENACFEDPWPEKYFKEELNNNELCRLFVEKENGEIVSFGSIWLMFENCDIVNIAVKPSFQRKGYGQKMLNHLIDHAHENGCEFVHLEVRHNNEPAINLYKKNKFEIVRTRKAYYANGDDAFDMIRNVELPKSKVILAIESSCDETACAIIDEDLNVLSSVVTSQIDVHSRFGGVIPEVASRMHVEQISTIVKSAIDQANLIDVNDVDAIAYTIGPGLIGSLHIGAIAAKSLSFFYKKPLIGVHHLKGHIFVNEMIKPLTYPMMALVVSGGHTELVYIENDESFKIIGTTLDDAIGEAYDKVARVMHGQYPGGPFIDKLAKQGKPNYQLPMPKVDGLNFSFSGLKNAVFQLVKREEQKGNQINSADLAYAFQETALGLLIKKTRLALEEYPCKSVVIAGGVACNSRLRELMQENFSNYDLILPPLKYCTDNALMIACAAVHYLKNNKFVSYDAPSKSTMSIED